MKIGVVVLSRFSSNRLPGKALMVISGNQYFNILLKEFQVVDIEKIVIATL